MKRIITIAAMAAILSTGAMAQTFFSLSAGNSGINVNVTNGMGQWPMYYGPYYGPVVPYYPSKKAVKKAPNVPGRPHAITTGLSVTSGTRLCRLLIIMTMTM